LTLFKPALVKGWKALAKNLWNNRWHHQNKY
jgi:hypothetical protein